MAEGFPIRDTMRDCASEWNKSSTRISPFLAAAQLSSELRRRQLWYDSYLQTVITGGGHAYDPTLDGERAVQRNIETGLTVAEELHNEGIVDLTTSVEAAAMPAIDGWLPDDWMTFWPLVMARLDYTQIRPHRLDYLEERLQAQLYEHINYGGLNMNEYRDRTIPKSRRLGHYLTHINAVREMLTLNHVPMHPVSRVISLVGTEESVGSTAERDFARALNIRRFKAVLAKVEPLAPEDLTEHIIGERIQRLRSLGVQALVGEVSQQFVLIEDQRPSIRFVPDANQPHLF
jgi:hypothetical protein